MAVTTGTHVGPWTEEDLVGLPDEARRYELLEGTLLVNPPPRAVHQLVGFKLATALSDAATPGFLVVEAVGVRLPEGSMFIPDVLVAARDVVLADHSGILDPAAVALVVDVVSPGSRTADRVTKPAVYARAGIPSFWRIELDDGPLIVTYRLEGGHYLESGSARPGEPLTVSEPFPCTVDPAVLQP